MKKLKGFTVLLLLALAFTLFIPQTPNIPIGVTDVNAATIKLNKKKATLAKGKTIKLKVSGTKQKVTWKSSNKKVATVSIKGKVTAKKIGAAIITAKIGKKKLKCKITVKNANSNTDTVPPNTDTVPTDPSTTPTDPSTTPTDPDISNSDMVWINNTGKKYHSRSSCSNMDSPYQVTREQAIRMGKDACKKCY